MRFAAVRDEPFRAIRSMSEGYQCCICAMGVEHPELVELSLSQAGEEGSQQVWAHCACLRKVIHRTVPLLCAEREMPDHRSGR